MPGLLPRGLFREFAEAHPEVHCPICGRSDLKSSIEPVVMPFVKPAPSDRLPGVPVVLVRCTHCRHVFFFELGEVDGEWTIGHPYWPDCTPEDS